MDCSWYIFNDCCICHGRNLLNLSGSRKCLLLGGRVGKKREICSFQLHYWMGLFLGIFRNAYKLCIWPFRINCWAFWIISNKYRKWWIGSIACIRVLQGSGLNTNTCNLVPLKYKKHWRSGFRFCSGWNISDISGFYRHYQYLPGITTSFFNYICIYSFRK